MSRDAIPAARPWRVGETTWMARRLSPMALQEMLNVLKSQVPDPRLEARKLIEGLPAEIARHVWDSALRDAEPWPPSLDSPSGRMALCSEAGMACVIYHALRKSHGGFGREQAAEIARDIDMDEFADLLSIALPAPEADESEPTGSAAVPTTAPVSPTTPGPSDPVASSSGSATRPSATPSA